MMRIALIGVPFDGYGRAGHQAIAAQAMRDAGISAAWAALEVVTDEDILLPAQTPERGIATTLMNEPALVAMTQNLSAAVARAVASDTFPCVIGGDCSALLGIMAGVGGQSGGVGLLVLDGHEDTIPLDVSEDGEAANVEIGLLLGVTGRTMSGPLAELVPTLAPQRLAMIGARDDSWRRRFNVASVEGLGAYARGALAAALAPEHVGREAAAFVTGAGNSWWLHVDLDVLDPEQFPAQRVPGTQDEPGGLTPDQLVGVMVSAARHPGLIGVSLAIYDPDQDVDGAGAQTINLLVREVAVALAER
ncbi:arginase family protein [Diaminobutyricimonas sp. LJ205]|uniref:arginase family protein n=1 Tax=Diaminobutyricimonas sp. LJ205 TaxID=2683590 RepID=UPI0012F52AF3|nr:arginase family protein [Diaminobutyricimonas sp. LJ205]